MVDVSKTGAYNLSTGTADGFHFFGTGNFTDTGKQSIVLSAVGTPSATGNFNFKPVVDSSCSFAITVTIQPPLLSTFTLAGAPDICTNPVIVGNYTPGMTLQASNTVTVNVNVTGLGNYSLSTDTINGISFSASGSFTKTGNQIVILKGAGTPVAARYLSFTIQDGSTKCSFALPVIDPEPLATYVLESGFGNPNPCIYTVQGSYKSNIMLSGTNTLAMRVYITVPGNFTVATNTVNGMIFSYSGTFTTMGSQLITLTGSGTPVNSGKYTFIPQIIGPHPLGGESCAFEINVQ